MGGRILEVDQAGHDIGLPGQRHERVEVRPGEQIGEALLEAGDHVVAQIGGHDRRHEPDAVLRGVGERRDRDVLAAADAVQVGVLQPDRADAAVGQLRQAVG